MPDTSAAAPMVERGEARAVAVRLGARSYDVLIGPGLTPKAGALVEERFGQVKCGIVTDENVARHHLAALEQSLAGMLTGTVVLKPGEATKSFTELAALSERLIDMGLERGEYYILLLFSVTGMMLMAQAADLIVVFLALESGGFG